MIAYFFTILLLFLIAPILLSFIKATKMVLLFKRPISLFQGYRNFSKLLHKETLISTSSSAVTIYGPFLVLAPLILILFFLPPIIEGGYYINFVDAFTITGLISLSGFFLMLLGMDSASAFGGMGSSREAFIASMVEPAMILTIFSVSLMAENLGIAQAGINLAQHFPQKHMASFLFAGISFFILLLAENGRIPIDNPETHLELTMVHEAMILDISGPYLAIIEMASSLKFTIFSSIFASLFIPIGYTFTPIIGVLVFIVKLFIIAMIVSILEVNTAKLRLFKIPNLLGISIVFAFLSLITFYVLGA